MKYQCYPPVVDAKLHTCAPLRLKVTFLEEERSDQAETLWACSSAHAGEMDCHMQRFGSL